MNPLILWSAFKDIGTMQNFKKAAFFANLKRIMFSLSFLAFASNLVLSCLESFSWWLAKFPSKILMAFFSKCRKKIIFAQKVFRSRCQKSKKLRLKIFIGYLVWWRLVCFHQNVPIWAYHCPWQHSWCFL